MSIELISPNDFHIVVNKLRQFFINSGFIEMYSQNRLSILAAERSCDPDVMRKKFHEINNGKYVNKLYSLFGKERVENELDTFLSNRFITRSGGGVDITRLIRSMKKEKLL